MTRARAVVIEAPRRVVVRDVELPRPAAGEVLVESVCSALSPGTELLAYRGELPVDQPLDATIAGMEAPPAYPLHYGYAAVGRVVGSERLVFAFKPHASVFVAKESELLAVPAGVSAELATFLPNLETAVSLAMDGAPLVGERVAIVGAGVVGVLTTALVGRMPLAELTVFEPLAERRARALKFGATRALDVTAGEKERFDLVFELSGRPEGLRLALDLVGFDGRIVVGSWYGSKACELPLGGAFHRKRTRLVSSQVSTVGPQVAARFSKERRLGVVWDLLPRLGLEELVTHRVGVEQAADAYRLVDERPAVCAQVVISYR